MRKLILQPRSLYKSLVGDNLKNILIWYLFTLSWEVQKSAVSSLSLGILLTDASSSWNAKRSSMKHGSISARTTSGILDSRRVLAFIMHQVLHKSQQITTFRWYRYLPQNLEKRFHMRWTTQAKNLTCTRLSGIKKVIRFRRNSETWEISRFMLFSWPSGKCK